MMLHLWYQNPTGYITDFIEEIKVNHNHVNHVNQNINDPFPLGKYLPLIEKISKNLSKDFEHIEVKRADLQIR